MNFNLHCGDAFELMRGMVEGSVDHVITDPPYGEQTHKGARTRKGITNGHSSGGATLIDFDSVTTEQFLLLCAESVRIARRWVIMTCEWRHAAAADESGLPVVRLGVWIKPNSAPQFTGDRPGTGWEAVLLLHRDGKKRWNGGGHHAVWTQNVIRAEHHPTQKPLPLLKKWLAQFTNAGETIFDPFMGSGTTGVAALQMQRRFVGAEIDPAYFALAEQRISEVSMQPHLLAV
ncbi:MAG: site-specific DNA-methyltransferase [Caldilineaceae bacterium]|nr:site-specific DNA-methyltransferase [Caldilineaceae bacterium]